MPTAGARSTSGTTGSQPPARHGRSIAAAAAAVGFSIAAPEPSPASALAEASVVVQPQDIVFIQSQEARVVAQHAADLDFGHFGGGKVAGFKCFQDRLPYPQLVDNLCQLDLFRFA